jgi:hypothetical protein
MIMDQPIGRWLSHLMLTNIDELATEVTADARQRVPVYAAMPPQELHAAFITSFQTVAATFATGDLTPMRDHLREIVEERIRTGASATSLIEVISSTRAAIDHLIERESGADEARKAEAKRLSATVFNNMRMIFSEANLRALTQSRK